MKGMKALWVVVTMVLFEGAVFLANNALESRYYGAQVERLLFSSDGKAVYGVGCESTGPQEKSGWIWAWDTETGRLRWKTRLKEAVYDTRLSPDSASLFTVSQGEAALWNTATGKRRCQLSLNPRQGAMVQASFTSDSKRLWGGFQSGIQSWNVSTGAREALWDIPKEKAESFNDFQFSAEGKRVLIQISNGPTALQLWDRPGARLLQSFNPYSSVCALSPSGNKVALVKLHPDAHRDNFGNMCLVVRNVTGDSLRVQSPRLANSFPLQSVTFVTEHTLLCKGGFGRPQEFLWDIRTNQMTEQAVTFLTDKAALSSDKRIKAIANQGGYQNRPPLASLYSASTGNKLRDLEGLAGR